MTRREWVAGIILGLSLVGGMYIMIITPVVQAGNVKEKITTQNREYSEKKAKQYLMKNLLTEHQANYVISQLEKVENKDHFIARFGAIFRHENGREFVNGESKRLAGRLKSGMQLKPFGVQFDGRIDQYNRTRYKNNSVSDWIYKSSYCVTDSHGGNGKGCPNWQRNVGAIVDAYGLSETSGQKQANKGTKTTKIYLQARSAQDKADKLRDECMKIGECQRSL